MVQWISALARTRKRLSGGISRVFSRNTRFTEESREDLEEALIGADVAPMLADRWITQLEKAYRGLHVSRKTMLAKILTDALMAENLPFSWDAAPRPAVMLMVGVNGSGKTTTSAKLAWQAKQHGRMPILGATDTFRAAGADQLKLWADRVGCDVVAGAQGADAAAVAYDALDACLARGADTLIIDTAGRMHTRQPLMEELAKISRTLEKRLEGAPHETWVVLDASLGRNALVQARMFHETTPLTGAVVTKLDGSARAGFIFSVQHELGIPVRMVGLGEGMEDMVSLDPPAFVRALLGMDEDPDGGER